MSGRSKRKVVFFVLEAPPPDLRDFIAFLPSQVITAQPAGRSADRPFLVWPRSQRSGYIPAEPYPLLRPAPV